MTTRCFRMDWLFPVLGVAVLVCVCAGTIAHKKVERRVVAEETCVPALNRLRHDHALSLALRALHEGRADEASQRLDLLLCWDILSTDAELASADPALRDWAQSVLARIAVARPNKGATTASDPSSGGIQEEAQRVLERAVASERRHQSG
jgi:hypothetical protein